MGHPKKDQENASNSDDGDKKFQPSEPEIIHPDKETSKPKDVLEEIDVYQKKIAHDWEEAKKSYQQKIDSILEDFVKQSETLPSSEPSPIKEKKLPRPPNVDELMTDVQKTLEEIDRKSHLSSLRTWDKPSIINVSRYPNRVLSSKWFKIGMMSFILLGALVYSAVNFVQISETSTLPYTHTSSLVFKDNSIYIVDWFRGTLYQHEMRRGLPLRAVEILPNSFSVGIAFTAKTLLSLNGVNHNLLVHALTEDHSVIEKYAIPAAKPAGLFFDGRHVWFFDNGDNILVKLRGNELTDVMQTFDAPETHTTQFEIINNRVWVLDGPAREINVYRLQDPLKKITSFDLDPILKDGSPTGLHVEDNKVWILTENPSRLVQIKKRVLEAANPNTY